MTPEHLKRLRRQLRLTQAELAGRLGVHPVTVARWETGARGIPELAARLVQRIVAETRGKAKRKK